MKVRNWITCVHDRGKWKDIVEKAITFKHYRKFSVLRRRRGGGGGGGGRRGGGGR